MAGLATMLLLAYGVVSLFPAWVPAQQTLAGSGTPAGTATFSIHHFALRPASGSVAATPPMGWNGFNRFYIHVTAAMVEAQARALIASGMAAAGYRFVNVDGGWDELKRGQKGELVPMSKRFPQGIKPVADYVHSLGLKFGIYASAGTANCAGTSAGSYGHFPKDAAQFAAWGVDYVKLDWCNVPFGDFPHLTHEQVSVMLGVHMRDALDATGRPMLLDVNVNAEFAPWSWARDLATIWRTGKDSHDHWASLLWNFQQNVQRFQWAGPGHWNDPDMLEIGNGGMTVDEYRTQFTLWAEMAAPLIAGNDLTRMPPSIQAILTNRAVIAVDQDPLGRQAWPVSDAGGRWVLLKPLAGGASAVVLFNSTDKPSTVATSIERLGLTQGATYRTVDLWTGAKGQTTGSIQASVPAHGVVMLEVAAA